MALNWSLDIPESTIHRVCADRVLARADNHQTLHGDAVQKAHEEVIWKFLREAEELNEDEVDVTVDMDIEEPLEDALTRAVDACVRILGIPKPSTEQMGKALSVARGYAVDSSKIETKKIKVLPPRYYALLPEVDLAAVVHKRLTDGDVSKKGAEFFESLQKNKRIADRSHITLAHRNNLPADQELWDRCQQLFEINPSPLFVVKLGHIVWNDRVMAVTVSDFSVSLDQEDVDGKGAEFVIKLPEELRDKLHITVGTENKMISPVEAKGLVSRWKEGQDSISSCELKDMWVKGLVKGLVH